MEDCDNEYRDLQHQIQEVRDKSLNEKTELVRAHEAHLLTLYAECARLEEAKAAAQRDCQATESHYAETLAEQLKEQSARYEKDFEELHDRWQRAERHLKQDRVKGQEVMLQEEQEHEQFLNKMMKIL